MVRKNPGFTIVELLIVIVVIAILAAISIVAYTGIQNKANDTAVQADMRNIGTQLQQYAVTKERYPYHATNYHALRDELASLKISPARNSYATSGTGWFANFLYFTNRSGQDFVLIARSKSGTTFYYSSRGGGVGVYEGNFISDGVGGIRSKLGLGAADNTGVTVWGFNTSAWEDENHPDPNIRLHPWIF